MFQNYKALRMEYLKQKFCLQDYVENTMILNKKLSLQYYQTFDSLLC